VVGPIETCDRPRPVERVGGQRRARAHRVAHARGERALFEAADDGEEVAFRRVEGREGGDGQALRAGRVGVVPDHLEREHGRDARALAGEAGGVGAAAHVLTAEEGRLFEAIGDQLDGARGGSAGEFAGELEQGGDAAGVVVGAGGAAGGVVVRADDDERRVGAGRGGAGEGDDVRVGARRVVGAGGRERFEARGESGGRELVAHVAGHGVEVLGVVVRTRGVRFGERSDVIAQPGGDRRRVDGGGGRRAAQ
jgi:hypothetical protein